MTASIEPVTDNAAFLEEWRRLYANAAGPPFYQSPAWIEAWLAGKPDDVTVYALQLDGTEEPALLAAFGLAAGRRPPFIGARHARCFEFGDPALDAVYVEFNDFLVAADADAERLRRGAAAALFETLKAADAFVFRNARPALASAVNDAARATQLNVRVASAAPTYQCDLATARQAGGFLDTVKGSAREQIARAIRLYGERGELRVKVAESSEDRRRAFEYIRALHAETWRRRGGVGVYANPAFTAFHDRLIESAPETVSLCTVYAGDEMIGGLHNFIHGDRVLNYQSGFRYEDDNRLKPGLVSHALAVQHYLDAGYAVYDLLAGDARYKKSLGEEGETLSTLIAERPGVRAGARSLVRRMKAATRRFAERRRT